MDQLFSHLAIADIHQGLFRNIVSLRESVDLFDDLSDNPHERLMAEQVELHSKPQLYQSNFPEINRPFEDALWFNAIAWPFKNWQESRFSDGSFGVWYGSDRVETTVYESAYHWSAGFLRDAGFDKEECVVIERKLYKVECDAALLDFREVAHGYTGLSHKTDYSFTHAVGARIHREGHPGLLNIAVRHEGGVSYAIFNPNVLSTPRHHSQLTYSLENGYITVEETPGITWLKIKSDLS